MAHRRSKSLRLTRLQSDGPLERPMMAPKGQTYMNTAFIGVSLRQKDRADKRLKPMAFSFIGLINGCRGQTKKFGLFF